MSLISIAETSATMRSGISVGSASTVISRVTCSSTPPPLTPGAFSAPSSSIATSAWIASSSFTSCRSMCWRLPRTGCSCCSLTTTGTALPPSISRSKSAAPSLMIAAHLAFGDLEGARLRAAGVDDARARGPRGAGGGRCASRTPRGERPSRVERALAIGRERIEKRREEAAACGNLRRVADDSKIPKGRVRRSAKLGSIVGVQGARYAGTKATNVGRSEEGGKEKLEQRHLETAMKMVGALGQMKGAAMKLGQFASFIDTEFIPEEYREIYQEQLAKLRTDAPAMPWEKVVKVLEEEYEGEPLSELFAEFEQEAFAAASIGQVHRAELLDGRAGRGQDPVPGDRRGARRRPAQRRHDRPPRPRPRPRPRRQGDRRRDPRAGDGGARLRVRGAEPALLRPRLPRPPLHLRAGSGHPALAPPRPGHRAGRGASASSRSRSCRTRSAAASARSSSAAASARCSTCSTSTPTPTPATTS